MLSSGRKDEDLMKNTPVDAILANRSKINYQDAMRMPPQPSNISDITTDMFFNMLNNSNNDKLA